MLIGNQSVINKSHARFYNPPVTTGSATTGARYARGRYAFFHPSLQKSRTIYWSENQSRPDGYGVGLAIFPALKSGGISSFTRIEGSGTLTASAISARLSSAELTGSGDLTADLSALVQAAAALAGSGSITQAEMLAVSALSAALAGSGSISQANLSSIVPMEAALAGTGTVANTTNLTGLGSLTASIEIGASDPLSPTSLATSVWSADISGYATSGTAGKKLNDASSGANPWDELTSSHTTSGTFGLLLQKLLSVAKFLGLK